MKSAPISALLHTPEGWKRFSRPVQVVETATPCDVMGVLRQVDQLTTQAGLYAVGFLCYEAAAGFGLPVAGQTNIPLVWFALFGEAESDSGPSIEGGPKAYRLSEVVPSVDAARFEGAFARIKEELGQGTTYQVNYSFKLRAAFEGDPEALFRSLVTAQRGGYGAFLSTGTHAVCSASPELFFARTGGHLQARPMKGTVRRGRTTAEDGAQRQRLQGSAKQRAENVMIVDMVRNDLGRVAEVGSVEVPELFVVERYPNVWQMTSLVTARSTAPLSDVLAAMHPSASVTGAPKASTMGIIAALEGEPRGIYTGAIGVIAPNGSAQFNVAIRTAVIDLHTGALEFGVGSGIVWDSDAVGEYEECLLKGSVLGAHVGRFDLVETLRWDPGSGFFLEERHLARMGDSAGYFGFPFQPGPAREMLQRGVCGQAEPQRARLLLSADGAFRVECRAHEPTLHALRVQFAREPIDESNVFLFHKTTHRQAYDERRVEGADEVLLWNRQGEVTEATAANVVVRSGAALVTPPVACGLLAGTFRAELLARGEIAERVLSRDDVRRAERVWLINSVHEWREVEWL